MELLAKRLHKYLEGFPKNRGNLQFAVDIYFRIISACDQNICIYIDVLHINMNRYHSLNSDSSAVWKVIIPIEQMPVNERNIVHVYELLLLKYQFRIGTTKRLF